MFDIEKWIKRILGSDDGPPYIAADHWQLRKAYNNLKAKELDSVVKVFASNIHAAANFTELPLRLATEVSKAKYGPTLAEGFQKFAETLAQVSEEQISESSTADDFHKVISPFIPPNDSNKKADLQKFTNALQELNMGSALKHIIKSVPKSELSIEQTLLAGLCSLWSCLEILAIDSWECAVNFHCPIGSILKSLKDKQIKVSDLYEYDFNMKNVMGTYFKTDFKFSNIEGIQKAFENAFEKNHLKMR